MMGFMFFLAIIIYYGVREYYAHQERMAEKQIELQKVMKRIK